MKKINLTTLFCTLLLLVLAQQINGQGWRQQYPDPTVDGYGHTLMNSPDGGFLLYGSKHLKTDADGDLQWSLNNIPSSRTGNRRAVMLADGTYATLYLSYSTSLDGIHLSKFDQAGTELWTQVYPTLSGIDPYVTSIDTTLDGGFVFIVNDPGGNSSCSCDQYHVVKTDGLGNLLWQVTNNTSLEYTANSIKSLADGGFAIAGMHGNAGGTSLDAYIEKRDENGVQLWEREWLQTGIQYLVSIIETTDGSIVSVGYGDPSTTLEDEVISLAKIDQSGNEIWFNEWSDFVYANPQDLKETTDGDLVVVGYLSLGPTGFILNTDTNGNENWRRDFASDSFPEAFYSVQPCPNGGLAISGATYNSSGTAVLIKTDALGYVYSHRLIGNVFNDEAEDCTYDGSETGLTNWVVTATGDETYYGSTDTDGNFDILLDTGEYEVTVSIAGYWDLCQASYTVQAANIYDSTELNIPVQPLATCPMMQVDLSTPFIRPCFTGDYIVNYCNLGTEVAIDATVEVELATELDYLGTTGTLLSQNGQTLLFDIGDVEINECGTFAIHFLTECDTTLVGQTLCSEAHIFPDTLCGEMFEGPEIELSGICENDSIKFNILNIGDNMPEIFEYIIIEDNIILMQGDFQLDADQSEPAWVPAMSGSTYHLVAAQDVDLPPFLGNPVAAYSVEGCVGNVNPGAFNQLPQNESEPWIAIDCQEVTAAFDPNDKTPSPTGWTEEHFIENRTDLEYRIRFQNTGTDTAFNVVVVDTLSSFLNPASIRPGAASHPYTFELSGQGVAKFRFANILLPDSTANETASHGFVNFKISQQPENQVGSVIENTAHIYFDFNAPIATNTTFHTIHDWWVNVVSGSVEVFEEGVSVQVFPNPFFAEATFKLVGYAQNGTLEIYDLNGRQLLSQNFAAGEAHLDRNGLMSGVYFFRMKNMEGVLASGKVVVR